MYNKLADIHSKFNVYPNSAIESSEGNNIIDDICKYEELKHLAVFYRKYIESYRMKVAKINDKPKLNMLKGAARSVDLPFIGNDVIESGLAKYMFVLEGSLSDSNNLTNTVLSCLWAFDDIMPYKSIINKYWRAKNKRSGNISSFNYIRNSLFCSYRIHSKSYITDAFRIGNKKGNMDRKKNRNLLYEEIELLKPEFIVAVGTKAKSLLKKEELNDNSRCINIYFPTKFRGGKERIKAETDYYQLRKRIANIEANYDVTVDTGITIKKNIEYIIEEKTLGNTGLFILFWTSLLESAKNSTQLHGKVNPSGRQYVIARVKKYYEFNYTVLSKGFRVELYINSGDKTKNKAIYDYLHTRKGHIQNVFNDELKWDRLDDKDACRISRFLDVGNYKDREKWPEIQKNMIDAMVRLEKAMMPPIMEMGI